MVVVTQIWTYGAMPYKGWPNQKVVQEVKVGYRLPPATRCPMLVYAVMADCWHEAPEDRIAFRTAYRRLVSAWDECGPEGMNTYDRADDMQQDDSEEFLEPTFDESNMVTYDIGARERLCC